MTENTAETTSDRSPEIDGAVDAINECRTQATEFYSLVKQQLREGVPNPNNGHVNGGRSAILKNVSEEGNGSLRLRLEEETRPGDDVTSVGTLVTLTPWGDFSISVEYRGKNEPGNEDVGNDTHVLTLHTDTPTIRIYPGTAMVIKRVESKVIQAMNGCIPTGTSTLSS